MILNATNHQNPLELLYTFIPSIELKVTKILMEEGKREIFVATENRIFLVLELEVGSSKDISILQKRVSRSLEGVYSMGFYKKLRRVVTGHKSGVIAIFDCKEQKPICTPFILAL